MLPTVTQTPKRQSTSGKLKICQIVVHSYLLTFAILQKQYQITKQDIMHPGEIQCDHDMFENALTSTEIIQLSLI